MARELKGPMSLHFDGLCRRYRDTVLASHAFILTRDGHMLDESSGYARLSCKNSLWAEYTALISGLRTIRHMEIDSGTPLEIYGDCKTIVNELTGQAKRNHPRFVEYHREASTLIAEFTAKGCPVSIQWVRRDANYMADILARWAYSRAKLEHRSRPLKKAKIGLKRCSLSLGAPQ